MRHAAATTIAIMTQSPIRLIVFDLGGVLVRICRSWPEGCAAAGVPVRGELREGYPACEAWQELGMQYQTGRIDGVAFSSSLSQRLKGLYLPEEIMAVHHAWILGEYEGVVEVIDRIHATGLPTAALSNTNHDHWVRMDEFPAFMRLRHRLASHLLKLHKPDPAIYRALERQLGHRGGEILFFDDLPENVAAAKALGWNAVQIDPHGRTDQQIEIALQQFGVL
jgi:glucose-1-phosphatase